MFDLTRQLCEIPGISGRESAVAACIETLAKQHTNDVTRDALGNVIVRKKGAVTPAQPILLAAHMDEVGFMVSEITAGGLLRLVAAGGLYGNTLPGRTLFLPRADLRGVLGRAPMHLQKDKKAVPNLDDLYLDIGARDEEEARRHVRVGDVAVFDSVTRDFGDDMLVGKALDDRLGCAMLLTLLARELPADATFAFTVQEELGLRGAATAAFSVRPGCAVVIDVAGGADNAGFEGADRIACLGKGPVVSFADRATFYDAGLYEAACGIAEENGIPWQTKTRLSGGTDAGAIHKAAGGARVIGISVTGRNIHTAASLISKTDASQALALTEKVLEHLAHVR